MVVRLGGWFFEPTEPIPISDTYELEKFVDTNYDYSFPFHTTPLESLAVAVKLMETPLGEGYKDGIFYIRAYQDINDGQGPRDVVFGLGLPLVPSRYRGNYYVVVNMSHLGRNAPRKSRIVNSAYKRLYNYILEPYKESKPTVMQYPIHHSQNHYDIIEHLDGTYVVMFYDAGEDRYINTSNWFHLHELMSGLGSLRRR